MRCAALSPAAATISAEEQLAARHAPIVYLENQAAPCDRQGQPYEPTPVEIVIENPDVALHGPRDGGSPVVAPRAADLFRRGKAAYLDYPGRPSSPGCRYEQNFRAYSAGMPAVAYAHLQRENGRRGLALQYWFFYYFDDWNNQHEGDWEMIQLVFDAASAEEALAEGPVRVSYSQHSGGERASWGAAKLHREGDRPIVYVATGSQASHFAPALYLGVSAGEGFGCDDARGPSRRVPLEARLLPAAVSDPADPFAWLAFQGRWGEEQPGLNNGPFGPATTKRWTRPLTHFDDDLRDASVTVPGGRTLGPNATAVFCTVAGFGGSLLGRFYQSPLLVGALVGVVALAGGGYGAYTVRTSVFAAGTPTGPGMAGRGGWRVRRRTLASAFELYRSHLRHFLTIGLIFVPVGLVASALNVSASELPLIGIPVELIEESFILHATLALLIGGVPTLVAFVAVDAVAAASLAEIDRGRTPSLARSYRAVSRRLGALVGGRLLAFGAATLLALTVAGIPWAMRQAVRWTFIEQAIVFDGAAARASLPASARAVDGHWRRTCAVVVVLGVLSAMAGPVVSVLLLLATGASPGLVNLISSLIYVAVLPLVAIAFSQLYRRLEPRVRGDALAEAASSPRQPR